MGSARQRSEWSAGSEDLVGSIELRLVFEKPTPAARVLSALATALPGFSMSAASASVEPSARGPNEANLIPDFEPRFPWWCPDFPNDGDLYARISVCNDSALTAESPRVRLLSITPDPLQKNHLPSDLIPKGLDPPKIISARSAPLYWDVFWYHAGEYQLATVEWAGRAKLLLQPGQDYMFEVEVSAANAPTNIARFCLRMEHNQRFPTFAFVGANITMPRKPPNPLPKPTPPVLELHGGHPDATSTRGETVSAAPDFWLSEDNRSATWRGEQLGFTPRQGEIVRMLYVASRQPVRELSQDYLLGKTGSEGLTLRDVFRRSKAWKRLIVQGSTRGMYRLDI